MLSWVFYQQGGPKGVHAAVTVGHKVYAFGEYCDRETCRYDQIDVHVFNTTSQRWTKLPPVTDASGERAPEVPSMRHGHTAALIEDIVYIWGGSPSAAHAEERCNVLYGFAVDTHRWFKPQVSGAIPEETGGHSACVLGRTMFIYSGYSRLTKCYTDDIHKLDTAAMVWTLLAPRGTPAPASTYHSATIIGTKMFVFGGRGDHQIDYNVISVFDTETNLWLRTPSAQFLPERRTCHSAFAYNGELYIFGGHNYQLVRTFNDLWKFNPETFSWSRVEPKGEGPCWMTKMCCCMVGDHIILLGGHRYMSVAVDRGYSTYTRSNDLYILELTPRLEAICKRAVHKYRLKQVGLPHDWTVDLKGGPKGVHAAVAVGHKVYSFGEHCDGETYNYSQIHVHVFNTVSLRWMKLPPVTAGRGEGALEVPSMRDGHTAVLIEDLIYIWGGCTYTDEYCNVLYAFDVHTHRWSKPEVSGTVPEETGGHSACVLGKIMYIYGGYKRLTKYYTNDIYKLDTTAMDWSLITSKGTLAPASIYHSATIIGTKMFVFGGRGDHQIDYNNISVFDTETNCWLSMPSGQFLPERRTCHSAFAYDGELYIFGGHNYQLVRTFNDLWKLNPETFSWKKVEPKGKGPCWITKMCGCMVGDLLILFGGYRYRSVNRGYRYSVPADNLFVLDLSPSLKTLCKIVVMQCFLDQRELPHDIRWELEAMTAGNNRHKTGYNNSVASFLNR